MVDPQGTLPEPEGEVLETGEVGFSIESRIIRELGERLVREADVAVLELIKNAYDADARNCTVESAGDRLTVADDGTGISLDQFRNAWMRLGTSSKGKVATSPRYGRPVTGEKGIGRLAVRYLGRYLTLTSVTDDPTRGMRTQLLASFDWKSFDRAEDLGAVKVPYVLSAAPESPTGTTLVVSGLKEAAKAIDWKALRTGSMGIVSPIRSLLQLPAVPERMVDGDVDPGFTFRGGGEGEDLDLADALLARYYLRAVVKLDGERLEIEVFQRDAEEPYARVDYQYPNDVGSLRADLRFFPRRTGLFAGAKTDGRAAYTWIRQNSGVKVFDRGFQVRPYGTEGDDWLALLADATRNLRKPASSITQTHFPMTADVQASTALNWMLRLPEPAQLVGVVQVEGRRVEDRPIPHDVPAVASGRDAAGGPSGSTSLTVPAAEGSENGLVAAADREGFLATPAFAQLRDIIRGAAEMIGYADREISLDEQRRERERALQNSRTETKKAIAAISADDTLSQRQRAKIVEVLEQSQDRIERQDAGARQKEQQLEVMSLLGVVAGFMTHEFGVALSELLVAKKLIESLEGKVDGLEGRSEALGKSIGVLEGFVRYSRAYIENVRAAPDRRYTVKPRLTHVRRAFSGYADKRSIEIEIDVESELLAPAVPAALFDGIAQNLLTNAMKAVTSSRSTTDRRIVFRAWDDDNWHRLQVSDTGVGIPDAVRDLVFDPLFTTTDSRRDPLGSGMGLGLALVRRGAAAFGGKAELIAPPPGFSTCVEVRFPRTKEEQR